MDLRDHQSALFSGTIESYQDVLFLPIDQSDPANLRPGAVYDQAGKLIPRSIHYIHYGRPMQNPPAFYPREEMETIPGRYLFGGSLRIGFGHILLESFARLWALERVGKIDGIFFLIFDAQCNPFVYLAQVEGVFSSHGLDTVPLAVADTPLRLEELIFPSQESGFGDLAGGSEVHRNFIRNLSTEIEAGAIKNIYVSRSKIGADRGRTLAEKWIESNLEAAGYTIIHPQELSILEQIRLYKGVEKMVSADSSAVHFAVPYLKKEAELVVISRRIAGQNNIARQAFQLQHQAYRHRPLEVIECVVESWGVPSLDRLGFRDFSVLDFQKLRYKLLERSFVSQDTDWREPSPQALSEERAEISRAIGASLVKHYDIANHSSKKT